jgi:hypothetical protein
MNNDDTGVQAGYDFDYEDVEPAEFDPELFRDKVAEELLTVDVAQDAKNEAEAKAAAEEMLEFDKKEVKKLKLQKKFYENLSKNKDLKLQEMFQIEKILAQIDWQQNHEFPRNFEKLKELIKALNKMRIVN